MHVPDRQRPPRHLADESGITLVEVMVAIFLLATAMMAMAQVATSGLLSLRDSTDRTTAISLATQSLEAARQVPWEELQVRTADHSGRCGTLVAIDEPATFSESVVCHSGGAIRGVRPFWGTDGKYELRTFVTAIPNFPNARRVTTVVEWSHGTTTRSTRSSTVIAQVARG
jgi:Tfp pilus assembly protein PilV